MWGVNFSSLFIISFLANLSKVSKDKANFLANQICHLFSNAKIKTDSDPIFPYFDYLNREFVCLMILGSLK